MRRILRPSAKVTVRLTIERLARAACLLWVKQTFAMQNVMSALPLKADIRQLIRGTDWIQVQLTRTLRGQMIWVSLGACNGRRCSPSLPQFYL